jgi:hypothetical protein
LVESWKAIKRRMLRKRAIRRQIDGSSIEGDDKSSIA